MPQPPRPRRLLPLAALLLGAWLPAAAAPGPGEGWYRVEVLIFQRLDPEALAAERWPEDPGRPSLDGATELAPPPGAWPEPAPAPEEAGQAEAGGEAEALPLEAPPEGFPAPATPPRPSPPEEGRAWGLSGGEGAGGQARSGREGSLSPSLPPGGRAGVGGEDLPTGPAPFQQLPEEELTLLEVRRRLERSPDYRPLVHVAWVQPAPRGAPPVPVHLPPPPVPEAVPEPPAGAVPEGMAALPDGTAISAGEAAGTEPGAGIPVEASALPAPTEPAVEGPAVEGPTVEGIVSLRRGRFLHVAADLLLRLPPGEGLGEADGPEAGAAPGEAAADGAAEPAPALPRLFRMRQSHQVPPGKLYYFDHPLFGMLVQVEPYEPPEEEPSEGGAVEGGGAGGAPSAGRGP